MRGIGLDTPLTKFDFFPALSIQLKKIEETQSAQAHKTYATQKKSRALPKLISTKINTPPTLERVPRCGNVWSWRQQ
jgi:hypothetical protein